MDILIDPWEYLESNLMLQILLTYTFPRATWSKSHRIGKSIFVTISYTIREEVATLLLLVINRGLTIMSLLWSNAPRHVAKCFGCHWQQVSFSLVCQWWSMYVHMYLMDYHTLTKRLATLLFQLQRNMSNVQKIHRPSCNSTIARVLWSSYVFNFWGNEISDTM